MNANDVIESYVTDVAVQLPHQQRNDVAFELRALLHEELQAKAEAAGRNADDAMATELVRAFGRPAEVAARYRPTLTIIDPADGHAFLRATIIGLAIIWALGLLTRLRQPMSSGWDFLQALGQAWGAILIPSLWWPGLLVVCFGVTSWLRSRQTQTSDWKPRAADRIPGGRVAMVMGLLGLLCGLFVLSDPKWVLDVTLGGRAAPAAYESLTYTDAFRQHQAPWLFALLVLNIPLMITVIVTGRWSPIMRRVELGLSLATCTVLAWTVLNGPVLIGAIGDKTFKGCLALIVVFTLIGLGLKMNRSVRPSPNQQIQA